MTSDLDYTIREKVNAINRTLAHQDDGLPQVRAQPSLTGLPPQELGQNSMVLSGRLV